MKILKISIIAVLLSCMTSCDIKFRIHNDKGVVTNIRKVDTYNEVTIEIIDNKQSNTNTYITFTTHKQYNINDIIYFTN